MKIAMDRAGRVVVPKPIRVAAGLTPGQELRVEFRDGAIVIEPAPRAVKLVRRGSLLVAVPLRGREALSGEQVNRAIRAVRKRTQT